MKKKEKKKEKKLYALILQQICLALALKNQKIELQTMINAASG